MTENETTDLLANQPRENLRLKLSNIIYAPILIMLTVVMMAAIFSGSTLIFYEVSARSLPTWFDLIIRFFIVPVGSFYNVYEAESSKHLNIFFIMLIGLFMARFVQRCSTRKVKFEPYFVCFLIVLILIQVYVSSAISVEHLADQIKYPERVIKYLEIIIVRNCNIAAAIIAAAIGASGASG